jgi:hypothetical protein
MERNAYDECEMPHENQSKRDRQMLDYRSKPPQLTLRQRLIIAVDVPLIWFVLPILFLIAILSLLQLFIRLG